LILYVIYTANSSTIAPGAEYEHSSKKYLLSKQKKRAFRFEPEDPPVLAGGDTSNKAYKLWVLLSAEYKIADLQAFCKNEVNFSRSSPVKTEKIEVRVW
jgi:hypothetical protein